MNRHGIEDCPICNEPSQNFWKGSVTLGDHPGYSASAQSSNAGITGSLLSGNIACGNERRNSRDRLVKSS